MGDVRSYKLRNTACFSEDSLIKLQEIMCETKVPAGSCLFMEGEPAGKMYFMFKGQVQLTKSTSGGKQFVLHRFQEGDLFGEPQPYPDSKQCFNAVAYEDSVLGAIHKEDLDMMLWQYPDLSIEFMKWLGLMHRMTQTKFQDIMLHGKSGALCSTLIRLANSCGRPDEDGIRIDEKLTNTELADYIGSARESVNRMLGDLKKAEAIALRDGYIIVKNLDYLRNLCHCTLCPKEICRM